MESVYKRLSQAIRNLSQGENVFTEIDVIQNASMDSWTEADYKKALIQANQIASAFYRDGKLVRFGPVVYKGERDYARFASKIVYAGTKGPQALETPNGEFGRYYAKMDSIGSPGRRYGTSRDDREPWVQNGEADQRIERQLAEVLRRVEKMETRQRQLVESLIRTQ